MDMREQLYIDGRWVTPSARAWLEVVNPATEEVIGRVPRGEAADVAAAATAAQAAFEGWSGTPPRERGRLLTRLHDALVTRAEVLSQLITREVGMPLKLTRRIQVDAPLANFAFYAKLVETFAWDEQVGTSLVMREPVGVVGCITPWNYPLHQIVAKVAPALAAGCTVVLKPSELVPLDAFILADAIHEAALPPGVFNLVSGEGPVAGEALVGHPGVDMISFTGSTRAGKRISEVGARMVKRLALELGGKSPAIVLEGADLKAAVKATVANCFLNSGQTCAATTRLLVPEGLYAEAAGLAVETAERFTPGDPFSDGTRLGPLASAAQRDRVLGFIRTGLSEGAELLCGGLEPPAELARGFFARPTVLGNVNPGATVAQEEIFGPVLCLMRYRDEDEAVAIANGTPYGLAASVWAATDERALQVARRIRAGQIEVNGGGFNLFAPFGGFKQSGIGREMGRWGFEEFLEYKSLQLKPSGKST